MGKDPVGAGTFCPSPMLVFYIPPCQKCQRRAKSFKFCVLLSRLLWSRGIGQVQSSEGGEFDPTLRLCLFFTEKIYGKFRNHRKIPVFGGVYTRA